MFSSRQNQVIESEIRKMLKAVVAEPTVFMWSFPAVMEMKKHKPQILRDLPD